MARRMAWRMARNESGVTYGEIEKQWRKQPGGMAKAAAWRQQALAAIASASM